MAFLRSLTLSQLSVHQIDEDYPVESTDRIMPVQHAYFDPGERIPSYELSQEQHRLRRSSLHQNLLNRSPTQTTPLLAPPVVTTTNLRSRHLETALSRMRDRPASPTRAAQGTRTLKNLGLKFLNARQHFLLAACRDASLVPCVVGLFQAWWVFFYGPDDALQSAITSARVLEHFLTGVWCVVAGYLLYSVLDGLMVRWIVTYSTTGAIVRMATMLAILVAVEEYLLAAFLAEGYKYALHTWILISCALTVLYIAQNFITLNIDLKGKYRPRFFDFYNIAVFAVVPVGMASFITMVGLLRSLLILRLDIDLATHTTQA